MQRHKWLCASKGKLFTFKYIIQFKTLFANFPMVDPIPIAPDSIRPSLQDKNSFNWFFKCILNIKTLKKFT